ncbi:MAG: hypothetical protein ACM3U1_03790 [Chloroflexota bacterium]
MIGFAIFSLLAFLALWVLFFKGYHVGSFPAWLKFCVNGFIIGFFIAALILFSALSFNSVRKVISPEKSEQTLIIENNGYSERIYAIYERDGWNGEWMAAYPEGNFTYTPRFLVAGRGRDTLRLLLDTIRIDQVFILNSEDIPSAVSFEPSQYPVKFYASDFEHYKADGPITLDHTTEWTGAIMAFCFLLALWFVALNLNPHTLLWRIFLVIAAALSFAVVYPAYYFLRTIIQNY